MNEEIMGLLEGMIDRNIEIGNLNAVKALKWLSCNVEQSGMDFIHACNLALWIRSAY